MEVTSLYTNIPQEVVIKTVSETYGEFHQGNPPASTRFLREMISLILQETRSISMEKIILKN